MRITANRKRFVLSAGILVAMAVSAAAPGATLYWDTNGPTATNPGTGTGSANNGTWGTSNFWTTDAQGDGAAGTFSVATAAVDALRFSAGTNGTGDFTVTVNGTVLGTSILFEEGNALITGGTAINLADAATITSSTGTGTINTPLTGAITSLTLNANSATSSITLGGANSYSGLTIVGSAGTNGVAGSQVILTGSNSSAGATRINNINTLVLNSTSNGGLASGLLTFGQATSSGTANMPILRNGTGSALSLSNLIAFPNFTSWVGFDGTQDIRFTNTGTINTAGFNTTTGFPTDAARVFYVADAAMTVTIDGVIDDVGLKSDDSPVTSGVNKRGAGRLVLTADNVYDGITTVYEGTLQIDGSVKSYTSVSGGTLAGTGTLYGRATIDGTLAIGDEGVGAMVFDFEHASLRSLKFETTGIGNFEIEGWTAGEFDLASGSADAGAESVEFNGTLNLVFAPGFSTVGSAKIFDFDSYSGSFASVQVNGLAAGYSAMFDDDTGIVTVALIPEPASIALAGLGLAMLAWRRRSPRT